jgi:hypothetical protein
VEGERGAILPGLGSIPEPIVISDQKRLFPNQAENRKRLAY